MKRWKTVALEMSLKPFRDISPAGIEQVCRTVWEQWLPLLRYADRAQVLLWVADGSEILDYRGNLDDQFEWAKYIGICNRTHSMPGDPEQVALHSRSYLYCDDPPDLTYRDLARIVATLRRVGQQVTGLPVEVGETFDPGPEFAESSFKYQRHREICCAGTMWPNSFVVCYATLNGDTTAYAGYPAGIPDGTPLGSFLGRQSQCFLTDLGFDYLWLSNGFGFGLETWRTVGPMFDGESFDPSQAGAIRDQILAFWRLFRAECPGYRLETRGTNLATGIDLASDASPLRDLYAGDFNLVPPPNSPWAALNGDFGLELAGYLSRIVETPSEVYPFRFYTHDPWWLNSPWLDRYGREPHDIYLPLSCSRIDPDGQVATPTNLDLLTIDDSYGQTPDQVPHEVIGHLMQARRSSPDQPGPVVLVYPFDTLHDLVFAAEPRPAEAFSHDWLLRNAINHALPVNTVVSPRHLAAALAITPDLLDESVLLSRAPDAGDLLAELLLERVESGGKVLLFGPLAAADPRLIEALGLALAEPLAGELAITVCDPIDLFREQGLPERICHREVMSGGGITAVAGPADANREILAVVRADDGAERVVAVAREFAGGGSLVWCRGTVSARYTGGHLLTADPPSAWFPGDLLLRLGLRRLGLDLRCRRRHPGVRCPVVTCHRSAGALWLAAYTPDTTTELQLRLPGGAPLLLGYETELVDGRSTYRLPRATQRECRVLVDQAGGVVSCNERHSGEIGIRRRFEITGLDDATVTFLPEPGDGPVRFLVNGGYPYQVGDFREPVKVAGPGAGRLVVGPVSGTLLISW